jgi:hypothetical protein
MRSLVQAVIVAAAFAAPVASFAQQSNAPLTRAQVRAQLVELEKAGYNPAASNDATYPAEIQAAEARVAADHAAAAAANAPAADTSGVGGVAAGSSASGQARSPSSDGIKPTYFGQ